MKHCNKLYSFNSPDFNQISMIVIVRCTLYRYFVNVPVIPGISSRLLAQHTFKNIEKKTKLEERQVMSSSHRGSLKSNIVISY